ncbi:fatty acid 2-hydroxylase-like [Engraulis encrasicolus]|uniref:fatty acid 2-hydroxylase-like n=1 Tax=Engraulis encrasicolus TaxID=184585 RepID=UPI002FD0EF2A
MYNEWVHQPVYRPIRLFESEFLEGRTQAAWYWVLIVWLPAIFYLSATIAGSVLWTYSYGVPMTFILGIVLWLFMVYCIHFLFHHPLSSNYYLITLHFLLHGHHHKSPNDRLRTVFPPSLAIALFTVLFMLLRCLLPDGLDISMLLGLLCAYVFTDMVHYYLHHCKPNENSYFHDIRTIHVKHHFEQPDKGLGIATKLWDWIFNTGIHPLGCSKYTGSTTTMGRRK